MSDLLSIGKSGVLAYQGALQTVGENVTNADTEGYARRSVLLREQTSPQSAFTINRSSGAFGGVQANQVQRVWDQYKATNAWSANADASASGTRAQYLSTQESLLNDSDSGVGTRLTAIFTNVSRLAANPADPSLRQTLVGSVSDAAAAINTTAANLQKLSDTMGTQATIQASRANDALGALAKVNLALHTAAAGTSSRAQLEDQRDSLLGTLSATMAIDTSFRTDGSVDVRMNSNHGPLLVSGDSTLPASLALQSAADGRLSMSVQDVSGQVSAITPTAGSLAGLIDVAATNAGRRLQLDGVATRLAKTLNDFQAAGLTPAGAAGLPLLTGTDAATLTAAALPPEGIAAASAAGVANGNLLDLLAARATNGVESGWKAMVTDQALMVSSAKIADSAASTRKDAAFTALDQTTGVDLDNEAAELLRFQQAYSASAKIIQAARQTLQDVLDLI